MSATPFVKAGGFTSLALLLAVVVGSLYGGWRVSRRERRDSAVTAPSQVAPTQNETNPPAAMASTATERGTVPPTESPVDATSKQALAIAAILFQGNCARQLSRSAVQDRLGLTGEQRELLAGLSDRVKEAQAELLRRPISEMPLILSSYDPVARDIEVIIDETLTARQLNDLHRIVLNDVRGPVALLAPCVVRDLKLDARQVAAIAAMVWGDFERAKSANLWELPELRQRTQDSRRRAEEQLNEAQRRLLPELVKSDPS